MTGKAGRPEGGAQVEVTGWAPRCLSCVSELVRCFKLIRARGFNCFKLQGCSGVLIMIEFGFNFKWGFLVIG